MENTPSPSTINQISRIRQHSLLVKLHTSARSHLPAFPLIDSVQSYTYYDWQTRQLKQLHLPIPFFGPLATIRMIDPSKGVKNEAPYSRLINYLLSGSIVQPTAEDLQLMCKEESRMLRTTLKQCAPLLSPLKQVFNAYLPRPISRIEFMERYLAFLTEQKIAPDLREPLFNGLAHLVQKETINELKSFPDDLFPLIHYLNCFKKHHLKDKQGNQFFFYLNKQFTTQSYWHHDLNSMIDILREDLFKDDLQEDSELLYGIIEKLFDSSSERLNQLAGKMIRDKQGLVVWKEPKITFYLLYRSLFSCSEQTSSHLNLLKAFAKTPHSDSKQIGIGAAQVPWESIAQKLASVKEDELMIFDSTLFAMGLELLNCHDATVDNILYTLYVKAGWQKRIPIEHRAAFLQCLYSNLASHLPPSAQALDMLKDFCSQLSSDVPKEGLNLFLYRSLIQKDHLAMLPLPEQFAVLKQLVHSLKQTGSSAVEAASAKEALQALRKAHISEYFKLLSEKLDALSSPPATLQEAHFFIQMLDELSASLELADYREKFICALNVIGSTEKKPLQKLQKQITHITQKLISKKHDNSQRTAELLLMLEKAGYLHDSDAILSWLFLNGDNIIASQRALSFVEKGLLKDEPLNWKRLFTVLQSQTGIAHLDMANAIFQILSKTKITPSAEIKQLATEYIELQLVPKPSDEVARKLESLILLAKQKGFLASHERVFSWLVAHGSVSGVSQRASNVDLLTLYCESEDFSWSRFSEIMFTLIEQGKSYRIFQILNSMDASKIQSKEAPSEYLPKILMSSLDHSKNFMETLLKGSQIAKKWHFSFPLQDLFCRHLKQVAKSEAKVQGQNLSAFLLHPNNITEFDVKEYAHLLFEFYGFCARHHLLSNDDNEKKLCTAFISPDLFEKSFAHFITHKNANNIQELPARFRLLAQIFSASTDHQQKISVLKIVKHPLQNQDEAIFFVESLAEIALTHPSSDENMQQISECSAIPLATDVIGDQKCIKTQIKWSLEEIKFFRSKLIVALKLVKAASAVPSKTLEGIYSFTRTCMAGSNARQDLTEILEIISLAESKGYLLTDHDIERWIFSHAEPTFAATRVHQLVAKKILQELAQSSGFIDRFFALEDELIKLLRLDEALSLIECFKSAITSTELEGMKISIQVRIDAIVSKAPHVGQSKEKVRRSIMIANDWGIKVNLQTHAPHDLQGILDAISDKKWDVVCKRFAAAPQVIRPVITKLTAPVLESRTENESVTKVFKSLLHTLFEIINRLPREPNKFSPDYHHQTLDAILEQIPLLFTKFHSCLESTGAAETRILAIALLKSTSFNIHGTWSSKARQGLECIIRHVNDPIKFKGKMRPRYTTWRFTDSKEMGSVKDLIGSQSACVQLVENPDALDIIIKAYNDALIHQQLDLGSILSSEHCIWIAAYRLLTRADKANDCETMQKIFKSIRIWEEIKCENQPLYAAPSSITFGSNLCNQLFMKLDIYNIAADFYGAASESVNVSLENASATNLLEEELPLDDYPFWLAKSYSTITLFINKINYAHQANDETFISDLNSFNRSDLIITFCTFIENLSLVPLEENQNFLRKVTAQILRCPICLVTSNSNNNANVLHPELLQSILTSYSKMIEVDDDSALLFNQKYWTQLIESNLISHLDKCLITRKRISASRNKASARWGCEAFSGIATFNPLNTSNVQNLELNASIAKSKKLFNITAEIIIEKLRHEQDSQLIVDTLHSLNRVNDRPDPIFNISHLLVPIHQAFAEDPFKLGVILGELAYLELSEIEDISSAYEKLSFDQQTQLQAIYAQISEHTPEELKNEFMLNKLQPFTLQTSATKQSLENTVICGAVYFLSGLLNSARNKSYSNGKFEDHQQTVAALYAMNVKLTQAFDISNIGIDHLLVLHDTMRVEFACLALNTSLPDAYAIAKAVQADSQTPSFRGDRKCLARFYLSFLHFLLPQHRKESCGELIYQLFVESHKRQVFKESSKLLKMGYIAVFNALSRNDPARIKEDFETGRLIFEFACKNKVLSQKRLSSLLSTWIANVKLSCELSDSKFSQEVNNFYIEYSNRLDNS